MKDDEIFTHLKNLNNKILGYTEKLNDRKLKITSKVDLMNTYKQNTFDQIDQWFAKVMEKVTERREQLKEQFKTIEMRERRRLKNKSMKTDKDLVELDTFGQEFKEFFDDFDVEMDYISNQAQFSNFQLEAT